MQYDNYINLSRCFYFIHLFMVNVNSIKILKIMLQIVILMLTCVPYTFYILFNVFFLKKYKKSTVNVDFFNIRDLCLN
jgi:hypothetical protein